MKNTSRFRTTQKIIAGITFLTIPFLFLLIPSSLAQLPTPVIYKPLVDDGLMVKIITKYQGKPIRESPENAAALVDTTRIFQVFFVFSATESSLPEMKKKNGYYHVGRSPNPADIMGWINENDAVEWNHRECAIFTEQKGRRLARIYDRLDDLKSAINNPRMRDALAMSMEPEGLDSTLKRVKMPLPVLDFAQWDLPNLGQQIAYKVAFIGAPSITPVTKAAIAARHGTADVMFVIDATLSMGKYIDAVKDVIDQIADTLSTLSDTLTFRLGLIAYRDYYPTDPNPLEYVTRRFVEPSPDLNEFRRGLANVKECPVSSIGCPEAMYDGIYEAIYNTNWSSLGLRVVLVIGDNSANEPSTGVTNPFNPHKRSRQELLRLAYEKGIRILCLKIEGTCNVDNDQEAHRQQLRALAAGMGPDTKGRFVEIPSGTNQTQQYVKELLSILDDEIERTELLLKVALEQARRGQTGTITRPPNITDDDWTIILNNLDPRLWDKRNSEMPVFTTGWLLQRDNSELKPFIDAKVMFTNKELQSYDFMLSAFQLAPMMTVKEFEDFIKGQYAIVAGEPLDLHRDEPISQFMQRKWGIPIKTGLLSLTYVALIEMTEQDRIKVLEFLREKRTALLEFQSKQHNWLSVGSQLYKITFVPITSLP